MATKNAKAAFVGVDTLKHGDDKRKNILKAKIDAEAWATLNSDVSRPFEKPTTGRIAVKVINHLGDKVMKVFGVG